MSDSTRSDGVVGPQLLQRLQAVAREHKLVLATANVPSHPLQDERFKIRLVVNDEDAPGLGHGRDYASCAVASSSVPYTVDDLIETADPEHFVDRGCEGANGKWRRTGAEMLCDQQQHTQASTADVVDTAHVEDDAVVIARESCRQRLVECGGIRSIHPARVD